MTNKGTIPKTNNDSITIGFRHGDFPAQCLPPLFDKCSHLTSITRFLFLIRLLFPLPSDQGRIKYLEYGKNTDNMTVANGKRMIDMVSSGEVLTNAQLYMLSGERMKAVRFAHPIGRSLLSFYRSKQLMKPSRRVTFSVWVHRHFVCLNPLSQNLWTYFSVMLLIHHCFKAYFPSMKKSLLSFKILSPQIQAAAPNSSHPGILMTSMLFAMNFGTLVRMYRSNLEAATIVRRFDNPPIRTVSHLVHLLQSQQLKLVFLNKPSYAYAMDSFERHSDQLREVAEMIRSHLPAVITAEEAGNQSSSFNAPRDVVIDGPEIVILLRGISTNDACKFAIRNPRYLLVIWRVDLKLGCRSSSGLTEYAGVAEQIFPQVYGSFILPKAAVNLQNRANRIYYAVNGFIRNHRIMTRFTNEAYDEQFRDFERNVVDANVRFAMGAAMILILSSILSSLVLMAEQSAVCFHSVAAKVQIAYS